ncbi:MAG: tetratricopeptide repeat protein, partial [Methanothrix sp.]
NITEDTLKKYKAVNPACKCLNTDPLKTWADAWKYKGDAFYKLKKYDQAIKAYNKTIELDENNTEAMKGRELVLEVLNNKTSSINITSMNSSQS